MCIFLLAEMVVYRYRKNGGFGYQKGQGTMNDHEIDRSGWRRAKRYFTRARWVVAYLVLWISIAYDQNTQYVEDEESRVAAILILGAIYLLLHAVNLIIDHTIDSDGSGDRRAKGGVGSVILVIILLLITLVWYCLPRQYAVYRQNESKLNMEREAVRKEKEEEAERRASAGNRSSESGSSGSGTTRSSSQNTSYGYSSAGKNYSSSSKSSSTGVKSYSDSQTSNYRSDSYSGSMSSTGSSKRSSGKRKRNLNPYAKYDDGYEAIYDDGEYDQDRYDCDPEYADGVDDAMDELDEDG